MDQGAGLYLWCGSSPIAELVKTDTNQRNRTFGVEEDQILSEWINGLTEDACVELKQLKEEMDSGYKTRTELRSSVSFSKNTIDQVGTSIRDNSTLASNLSALQVHGP
ncbi:hypothetical protein MMC28_003774 [Mycoblastus sanguinarius]|nr:hypothetical protein [Mycoblastus sanguinarius]